MLPLDKGAALERVLRPMTITAEGWFSWAERDPGPLSKTNGGRNTNGGVVLHSAEGYAPLLMQLVHDEARRASWMVSNLKNGRFIQHYSVYAQTWTSGSGWPNNNLNAWENEGVKGEPLTAQQNENNIRAIRELSELGRWKPGRPTSATDKGASLWEHNECVRWGSEPTACPSGRIPWDLYLSRLEDDMAERVWCSDRMQTWILGKTGKAAPVAYPVDDKIWEALYGPHTKAMTGAQLDAIAVK